MQNLAVLWRRVSMRALVTFGIILVVMSSASVAWACTANAVITPVSPQSGTAGTAVTVSGEAFSAGSPVEIRWGSATGLLLARALGSNFTVEITIPDARPGTYTLVAIDSSTQTARSGFFTLRRERSGLASSPLNRFVPWRPVLIPSEMTTAPPLKQ